MSRIVPRCIVSTCFGMVLIGPLLASQPCEATFEFLRYVTYDCNPAGLPDHHIVRIYAEFNDQDDRLVSVFGNAASPASITCSTNFFQHPMGGNIAPDAETIAKDPTVMWDTFCTIGLAQNIEGADQTNTSPGFPSLPVVNHTSMFWSLPGLSLGQGAPDAGGRVLILQLTMPDGTSLEQVQVGLSYRLEGTTLITLNNVTPILLPLNAGDINGSFVVDIDDLFLVLDSWGATGGGGGPGIADVTDDGMVDIDDLFLVIAQWGSTVGQCPP